MFNYSEGEKEGVGVEDVGFLCSLMCFIPWAKFIAIPSPDSDTVSDSGISEDDASMIPTWNSDKSKNSLIKSSESSWKQCGTFEASRNSLGSTSSVSELDSLSNHSTIVPSKTSRHGSPSSVADTRGH